MIESWPCLASHETLTAPQGHESNGCPHPRTTDGKKSVMGHRSTVKRKMRSLTERTYSETVLPLPGHWPCSGCVSNLATDRGRYDGTLLSLRPAWPPGGMRNDHHHPASVLKRVSLVDRPSRETVPPLACHVGSDADSACLGPCTALIEAASCQALGWPCAISAAVRIISRAIVKHRE